MNYMTDHNKAQNDSQPKTNVLIEKDTALIFRSRVIYVFTLRTIYLHSTCSGNVGLTHWQARLSGAVNTRTATKVHILEFFKLRANVGLKQITHERVINLSRVTHITTTIYQNAGMQNAKK